MAVGRQGNTVGFKVVARRSKRLENELARDITKLTQKEFRTQASHLFSAVNKRIKRLENSNVLSPALDALKKSDAGSHFTVRGKSDSELINEYNRALAFYNLHTATVSGARQFTNELKNLLGDNLDKDYISSIFDMMHTISERLGSSIMKGKIGTNEILQDLYENDFKNSMSAIKNNKTVREDFIMDAVNRLKKQMEVYEVAIEPIGGTLF